MNVIAPVSVVGSWRTFGLAGPVYQVTGLAGAQPDGEPRAKVRVLESGEELYYKLRDILDDPLAD